MDTVLNTHLMFEFGINRLIENNLRASYCEIVMDIEFKLGIKIEEQQENISILRHWIDNILDNCVAYNVSNPLDTTIFGELDNNVMFCPAEPHDYLLLLLIVAKINAIGNGSFTVINASINSNTSRGFGNSLLGDPLDLLPSAEDWMGEIRFWDQPWWNRSDGGMMDMPVLDGEDPTVKPDILIDMRSKNTLLLENGKNKSDGEPKPAEIIKPNFRPTIIKKD